MLDSARPSSDYFVDCLSGCSTKALNIPLREVPGLGHLCTECMYGRCGACGHHDRSHERIQATDAFGPETPMHELANCLLPDHRPCRFCNCTEFTRPSDASEAWELQKEYRPSLRRQKR